MPPPNLKCWMLLWERLLIAMDHRSHNGFILIYFYY